MRIEDYLEYAPDIGGSFLRWVIDKGKMKAGTMAGTQTERGYWVVCFDGKMHKAHRVVWFLVHGKWPSQCIDHIDRNPANNAIENLRDCSLSENQINKRPKRNSVSGYKGVTWNKAAGKYQAAIRIDGKSVHLGLFDTAKAASDAYEAKALERSGQ